MEEPNKLLSYDDVAEYLGCSQRLVRLLAEEGQLTPIYLGLRAVRFDPDDVARFVARRSGKRPRRRFPSTAEAAAE